MLAGADEISSGSVGLVYLAAILPALTIKLTAPYWCLALLPTHVVASVRHSCDLALAQQDSQCLGALLHIGWMSHCIPPVLSWCNLHLLLGICSHHARKFCVWWS